MPYKKHVCESCNRNAHFKAKYDSKPVRCSDHKFDSDITCGRRRCEKETCHRIATFGLYKSMRCSFHRHATDSNCHSSCIVSGCNTFANFGPIKKKRRIRCRLHKLSGDKAINYWCSNRLCENKGTFGKSKSRRCNIHKLEDDLEIKVKESPSDPLADLFDFDFTDSSDKSDVIIGDLPVFYSDEDALLFAEYMNPLNI